MRFDVSDLSPCHKKLLTQISGIDISQLRLNYITIRNPISSLRRLGPA